MLLTTIKKITPPFIFRKLRKYKLLKKYMHVIGKVNLGDMNRSTPFDRYFGYTRGGPIDRYFIEQFLSEQAGNIKDRVLEIGDNEYTLKFGNNAVRQSDILHINSSNTKATIIGDLSDAPHIANDSFDCIVLTQTLHLIYNYKEALRTCYRILKPGGTLLLTTPGITPIDAGEWKEIWYWAFTDKGMEKLLQETFPKGAVEIKTYGNVFTASAFLYGMGLPEVPKDKLDFHDPQFQVIIAVKATKNV